MLPLIAVSVLLVAVVGDFTFQHDQDSHAHPLIGK